MSKQLSVPIDNPAPDAKAVIKALLTTLKIKRIIYVDDYFERGVKLAIDHIAVGLYKQETKNKIEEILPSIEFDLDDQLGWERELKELWGGVTEDEHQRITSALLELEIIPTREDRKAADAVRNIIPDSVAYEPISPAEWDTKHPDWFAQADGDNKILCLFDQQFSHIPVGGEIPLDGLKMLENAVRKVGATEEGYNDCALFGILSHQFTIEEERARGIQICADYQLPVNIFLPLSKKRTRSSLKLAEGIQMLTLNLYAGSLKNLIKRIMADACRKAGEKLDGIDVFAFDDMILRSSIGEGVWEGETLVRLFSLLQQQYGRDEIASDATAVIFNQQVELARAIASPRLAQSKTSAEILPLRRLELYHSGTSLNAFHTPLRLGDIFKAGDKRYILLAPPCDLMVRSGQADVMGKRGKKPGELEYVELFKIHDITLSQFEGLKAEQLRVLGFLQHYKPNKLGRISFKERISVPVHVLDLAVLDKEGHCRLDIQQLPSIPVQFHQAWRSRFDILIEYFKALATSLDTSLGLLDKSGLSASEKDILIGIINTQLNLKATLPIEPVYKDGKLDFKLQRIDHYKYTVSQHLLDSYTNFLSRPAEEHDFSAAASE
jgi:hypothetical protein